MKFSVQLLALLLFGFLLVSCDSSGGNDDGLPVEGTWEEVADQETPIYLEITSESVTGYESYSGECYNVSSSEIVERDGNNYTLRQEDGNTTTVMMTVDGNELTVQSSGDVLVYEETNVDPSKLERCN
jgi:hypothetical protein